MKARLVCIRALSLLVMLAFFVGVRPGSAQTQDIGPAVESSSAGNEADLDQSSGESAHTLTSDQRLEWFIKKTIGPRSAVAGIASAGFGTSVNRPQEYGGTWQGFYKRYETRFAGIATSNAMEATLGAILKEDPRYFRVPNEPFRGRVRNVIKMTFDAYRGDGKLAPAYGRYIGITGSNFLANTWRVHSEAILHDAALRTLAGFLGRMGSNTIEEFWPDVKLRIFHE